LTHTVCQDLKCSAAFNDIWQDDFPARPVDIFVLICLYMYFINSDLYGTARLHPPVAYAGLAVPSTSYSLFCADDVYRFDERDKSLVDRVNCAGVC